MNGGANAAAGAKIKPQKFYGAKGKAAANVGKIKNHQCNGPGGGFKKYFRPHLKILKTTPTRRKFLQQLFSSCQIFGGINFHTHKMCFHHAYANPIF